MIDPRLLVHDPGTVLLPGMVAVAQEMLDAGYPIEDIDPWMGAALDWCWEHGLPTTEANAAMALGLPAPTQAQIDEAEAAIAAAEGGHMPDWVIGPGFKAEIAKRGWHPASDEDYFAQTANAKVSVCVCVEGILWYSSASNKVGATPFE